MSPELRRTIEDGCDKPFELRTESEKEELYEKIAEQLAMIADSYDFNSKFSSDLPPPKASTLFAPATTVVSPEIGDEDVFSSSVDPPMPASGQGEGDQDTALEPPQVIVQPGSPHISNSGDQSPPLEGAVGGVNVTETGGNLLNPNQPCMFHSTDLFNSTRMQSGISFIIIVGGLEKICLISFCYFHIIVNYEAKRAHSIEKRIGAILRDKGDKHQADVSIDY